MNTINFHDFKFNSIFDVTDTFTDNQICIDYLEKVIWNGNPVSPFDSSSEVYKCENGRYICKNTRKYFNIKTNTIFENTKVPLRKWFAAIWLYSTHKCGLSSLQISRDLNVTQKTGWFILQRIRKGSAFENNSTLENEVEVDETYVGGKNKNRHWNKKRQLQWTETRNKYVLHKHRDLFFALHNRRPSGNYQKSY